MRRIPSASAPPRLHQKPAGSRWWWAKTLLFSPPLFFGFGCSSAPPPVRTAAVAQSTLAALVDHEVAYVRGELRGAYLAAAAGCGASDRDCQHGAQQRALVVVGQRVSLARSATEAGNRSADLIDQANRCPDHDSACVQIALAAASAHAALATAAVRQLQSTRPQETSP